VKFGLWSDHEASWHSAADARLLKTITKRARSRTPMSSLIEIESNNSRTLSSDSNGALPWHF